MISQEGRSEQAKQWFKHLQIGEVAYLEGCEIYDNQVKLSVKRLGQKNWLLILRLRSAQVKGEGQPQTFSEDYRKRWGIETLFGCLKRRGFNFEDTHLCT